MARRRVALAGVVQGEGPWINATGEEKVALVGPLADGERVLMHVEGSSEFIPCVKGVNPISLSRGQRFRFVKTGGPTKTCVEVRFKCPELSLS